MLLARHGLPDGHPLDGEAFDGLETLGADGEGEGDEGVEIVDVEDRVCIRDVGRLGVDRAAGTEQGERGVAEHLREQGVGVRVQDSIGVAGDSTIGDPPAGRGNGAAMAVALEGRGGVLAPDMADLAL